MTAPLNVTSYATALLARDVPTIEASLYAAMASNNVQIAGFGDFSVQRGLTYIQAQAQAELEQLRVQMVQAGVASTAYLAGDDWVDVTLGGFFFESRIQASKSQLALSLTAPSSPVSAAPRAWVAQADDGMLFENVDAIKIAANGTVTAAFECRQAGTIGNAPTGTVDHMAVAAPGVTVTNLSGSLLVAGRDQETSADYLIRCIGKWGTLGRGGNALAYYYLIPLAAPTVTRILIRDDNPFGPGSIGICLANAAGPATNGEVTAAFNLLSPIKPLGSGLLRVFAAAPQIQTVAATLYGSSATLLGDAEDALATLAATYPIGSLQTLKLYLAKIIDALMNVPTMTDVVVATPAIDVALAPYSVISITPSLTVAP